MVASSEDICQFTLIGLLELTKFLRTTLNMISDPTYKDSRSRNLARESVPEELKNIKKLVSSLRRIVKTELQKREGTRSVNDQASLKLTLSTGTSSERDASTAAGAPENLSRALLMAGESTIVDVGANDSSDASIKLTEIDPEIKQEEAPKLDAKSISNPGTDEESSQEPGTRPDPAAKQTKSSELETEANPGTRHEESSKETSEESIIRLKQQNQLNMYLLDWDSEQSEKEDWQDSDDSFELSDSGVAESDHLISFRRKSRPPPTPLLYGVPVEEGSVSKFPIPRQEQIPINKKKRPSSSTSGTRISQPKKARVSSDSTSKNWIIPNHSVPKENGNGSGTSSETPASTVAASVPSQVDSKELTNSTAGGRASANGTNSHEPAIARKAIPITVKKAPDVKKGSGLKLFQKLKRSLKK